MPRKSAANRPKQRSGTGGEISGLVVICVGLLLLIALFSYDRGDIPFNRATPNDPVVNWIGPIGAWTAFGLFFVFGLTAYFLPAFVLAFGARWFWPSLDYLKRRWVWIVVFLISCMGPLHLYREELGAFTAASESGSPGGILGIWMHQYGFRYFGKVGASIIFATLYLVSLFFLTNSQLSGWMAGIGGWVRRFSHWLRTRRAGADSPFSQREAELNQKVKELEEEAQRLQQQVAKGGEADWQPTDAPVVRDLSVPDPRKPNDDKGDAGGIGKKKGKKRRGFFGRKAKESEAESADGQHEVEEGETIPAEEVMAAATVEDVLGNSDSSAQVKGRSGGSAPEDEAEVASPDEDEEAIDISVFEAPPPRKKPRLPKSRLPARPSKRIAVAEPPKIGNYRLPSLDHLNYPDDNLRPSETKDELMGNARLMQSTLKQFGIDVALGDITKGPTITRYELHPAPGVRLERIVNLTNNIAAALKAERIHILAPVPGKSSVGVEVPNRVKTKVIMRDLLEADQWRKSRAKIPLALGKDVYGNSIIGDLAEMPHLLIAGSTGSGKSVAINSIIASLLYRFSPEELRLVMIDPKVVELQQYNTLPHLVVPVVTDPKKVILALRWVVSEMEKRYQIFAKVGVRNIHGFNKRPKEKPPEKKPAEPELPLTVDKENIEASEEGFAVEVDEEIVVPREDEIEIPDQLSYIVVIIDELADLMLVAPSDVEMAIARITQMARAAGIHCIIATQRPSVDVITGVIKANIPARIAFQVAAKVDSRTILDAMGADKLLGKGDMLYLPPGSSTLIRAQGVLITDEEIQSLVDNIVGQAEPSYEKGIHQELQKPSSSIDLKADANGDDADEALLEKCVDVIRTEQKASVSLLQRRLRIGYTRAARLMDQLEDRGIVGPSRGAEPRDILVDLDEDDPMTFNES